MDSAEGEILRSRREFAFRTGDRAHVVALAKWRGWLCSTAYLLRDQGLIGLYMNCWAFPNIDSDGDIRTIHYRVEGRGKVAWRHDPTRQKTHALIFGDLKEAKAIAVFESQWDAITLLDKLCFNPFACHDWAFVSTRGAANAKVLAELDIPPSADPYLFPQNDEAGTRWTDGVLAILGRSTYVVSTPAAHKDLGEWGLNGLTSASLMASITGAVLRKPAPVSKPSPNLKTALPGVPDALLAEHGWPVFLNLQKVPSQLNERFWAALYASENVILYEPDEREFFVYDPLTGLYQQRSVDTLRGHLQARIRAASLAWPNFSDILRLATEVHLRGVIAFLRGQVERRHAFKSTGSFIHLANGVLVLTGGKFTLEKFDPGFMSRNQSPVSYDEKALAPRFRNEF